MNAAMAVNYLILLHLKFGGRSSHYGCDIVPVQVVAHTECFVTIRPWKGSWYKKDRRTCINDEYFPTYSFARAAKLEQLYNNTVRLRKEADQESAKYAELSKREEPTVPQE